MGFPLIPLILFYIIPAVLVIWFALNIIKNQKEIIMLLKNINTENNQ